MSLAILLLQFLIFQFRLLAVQVICCAVRFGQRIRWSCSSSSGSIAEPLTFSASNQNVVSAPGLGRVSHF